MTKEYCEGVRIVANDMSLNETMDPCELSHVLDVARGAHHGGYERGFGLGYSRKRQRNGSSTAHTVARNLHELAKKDKKIQEMEQRIKQLENIAMSERATENIETNGSEDARAHSRLNVMGSIERSTPSVSRRVIPSSGRHSASSSRH